MPSAATELNAIIEQYQPLLLAIPEDQLRYKLLPHKWSKQEIIGHLVDSAQNNTRRFIVAQYEEQPGIVYDQDKWVAIAGYNNYPSKDIIDLWTLLNKNICYILNNSSAEALQRQTMTDSLHSLEWIAQDYCKHLLHHLHVILELEPVAYP